MLNAILCENLPQNAIEARHYADIVPLGGSVQPLRGGDSIMWTISPLQRHAQTLHPHSYHARRLYRTLRWQT